MSEAEDERFEADRLKELEECRSQWADLDERFGPGSFGRHEAMHVANMLAGLVYRELCEHCAVVRDPYWYKLAREACANLTRLYSDMGQVD